MMTRVLIADSDESLAAAMMRSLAHFGIEAVACSSPRAVRAHLDAQRFDMLVIDQRMASGVDQRGAGIHEPVLTVITASFVGRCAEPSGVRGLTLLHKPFSSLELLCVIQRALGQPGAPPVSTVDALRRAHAQKSNLCLCIRPERHAARSCDARIYVEGGEVVHAAFGALEGVAALKEILRRRRPIVEQSPDMISARSIQRPFKPLILEILHEIDVPSTTSCHAFPSQSTGLETVED
jgi:CheY-like chemotaxis protein